MNPAPVLRVRRATFHDLAALQSLWESMRLPPEELGKRLTEFQVVENAGEVLGAMGIQFSRPHGLLHSEGYSDFSVADAARNLFWARIQILAAHHGIFRLWTQERSPFWKSFGFQPPTAEILAHLPAEWKNEFDGGWLTFQLKDEEKITTALEKHFIPFSAGEKMQIKKVSRRAGTINLIITIAGFAIGISGIAFAIYLFIHRNPFSR